MRRRADSEVYIFGGMVAFFALLYYLPVEATRFQSALIEAFTLAKWYAREHVLLCLVPAFFIAGGVGVFISKGAVVKYFGDKASKWLSYSVASISGTILAVCSCTVLPLFGSIYMRGAGLGPAVAFLYSGPAINVLAIVLTARVLGWQLGVARALGAVVFSVVIGLVMHLLFLKEERGKGELLPEVSFADRTVERDSLWSITLFFVAMIGILVFANWGRPLETTGVWYLIFKMKWGITALFALILAGCLWRFFRVRLIWVGVVALAVGGLAVLFPGYPVIAFVGGTAGVILLSFVGSSDLQVWRNQSWAFTKQIMPLLFGGVLLAGLFLGSQGGEDLGLIPNIWIQALVGDSPSALMTLLGHGGDVAPAWLGAIWPVWTNLFASLAGALMYFATLTEVPILRGLIDSGMGEGPALALLLAGPALSLPSMLVINSVLGPRKTLTFVGLVVVMATLSGLLYGVIIQ